LFIIKFFRKKQARKAKKQELLEAEERKLMIASGVDMTTIRENFGSNIMPQIKEADNEDRDFTTNDRLHNTGQNLKT